MRLNNNIKTEVIKMLKKNTGIKKSKNLFYYSMLFAFSTILAISTITSRCMV
jgi:hypothetical protein